jgi:hypothetical protein
VTKAAMTAVGELARLVQDGRHDWRVSLRGFDDVARDVTALLDDSPRMDACQVVLEALAPRIEYAIWDIVAATTILGRRRLTVRRVAKAFACSCRSLEHRLHEAGGPEARSIVHWVTVLHAAWRLEVRGLTPRQAAIEAGYRGRRPSAALSERVHRHLGRRPRALGRPGVFVELLGAFLGLLCPDT